MTSKVALKEFTAIARERLIKYGHLTISGIGTLKIESVSSTSETVNDKKFVLHPPKKQIVLDTSLSATDASLVSELASNLGIPHEEADEVVHLLSKEILEQVPVAIPDLGVITRSENKLGFSADPELIALIHGAHAEMDSIEINQPIPIQPAKPHGRRPWIVATLSIVAALVVGSYFIIRIIPNQPQPPTTTVEPADPVPIPPESAVDETIPDGPVTEGTGETVDTPPVQPDTRPILLDREAGGYTIILASFSISSSALATVEQYREIYPDLPVDTLVSSDNRYRVTIGQVPTLPEAVALKNRLSEIPSDAWPVNILNHNNL